MVDAKPDVLAIFSGALAQSTDEDRSNYLDKACGDDIELRGRLDDLLRAHQDAGHFLGGSASATVDHDAPLTQRPGTIIGPYKLLQQIGEGGMGVVFMAEQSEPIQRNVALKIIKPGMDTRQVIARFEAERQALALMDHPNIAKVLDAGTTGGSRIEGLGTRVSSKDSPALDPRLSTLDHSAGRPYFVMELVKGVPITKYCDEKHLPLRERLELLLPVCQAVQHAHQKGVIHRDLKPTNVLVAEYDDHAVPKVIDFGVAKATAQKLTDRTMFTEFGQVVGTVEYMSPEQAKFNQLDIDTRSDIYSLGVLLYELLTGSTPFGRKRLTDAAFDEALRIIREEEPQKPSTRLSTTDELPSIAANRHTEPARLSKEVSGELDWIVMKCLEKDRNRRYETANGLSMDLQRYLSDETVEACPPSAGYRVRKFLRRNKVAAMTATIVATSLVLATIVSLWQATLARRAETLAETRLVAETQAREQATAVTILLHELFGEVLKAKRERTGLQPLMESVIVAYRKVIQLQPNNSDAHLNLGLALGEQGRLEEAVAAWRKAIELKPTLTDAYYNLGTALDDLGKHDEAIAAFHKAIELKPDYSDAYGNLGGSLRHSGKLKEAVAAYRKEIELRPNDALAYLNLGILLNDLGRFEESIAASRKAIELKSDDAAYNTLGLALGHSGNRDGAIAAYRKSIEIAPQTAAAYGNLGLALDEQGNLDEAIVAYRKAIELKVDRFEVYNNLASILATASAPHRDPARALELATRATELGPMSGEAWNTLGIARYRVGQWQPAIEALEKSIKLRNGGDANDWFFLAIAHWQLGHKEDARKWYDKAVEWMDKNQPKNEELLRFRAEAAELLGITN